MKKQVKFIMLACTALMTFSLISCEENEETKDPVKEEKSEKSGSLVLDSYVIDFGEFEASSKKSATSEEKEVVLTLTNETDTELTGLSSYIEFEGDCDIKMDFKPLKPGESIDVIFTYSPVGAKPGVYTGIAKLIPLVGEEVVVELKATVVAPTDEETPTEEKPVTLSTYFVDWGNVDANNASTKSTSDDNLKKIAVTVTNNSDEVLTGVGSSISFPGHAAVNISWSPLQPGESSDIYFEFSPSNLGPGEYTGTATIIPSIGDEITVDLKATVVASSDDENPSEEKPVTLSTYSVDWGNVNANAASTKSASNDNLKTVVVTVTNNSDEVLIGVGSSISFPGHAAVNFSWSPLQPGESSDINFEFSPSNLGPGEYTGTAKIMPSIGDEIIVDLKATVVAKEE